MYVYEREPFKRLVGVAIKFGNGNFKCELPETINIFFNKNVFGFNDFAIINRLVRITLHI